MTTTTQHSAAHDEPVTYINPVRIKNERKERAGKSSLFLENESELTIQPLDFTKSDEWLAPLATESTIYQKHLYIIHKCYCIILLSVCFFVFLHGYIPLIDRLSIVQNSFRLLIHSLDYPLHNIS